MSEDYRKVNILINKKDSNFPTKEDVMNVLEQRHGVDTQERFTKANVAICGLGGLGSNVAIALARAGVGTLHLIDFDKVDLANLNRQQYKISQIGMYKTKALKDNLKEIAPYCNVLYDTVELDEENVCEILKDADIVCEAFDKPECKAMLVNEVLENMPDKTIIAASGMSGLHSANSIKTAKITKRLYLCGDRESDVKKDKTLYAARVMVCAAHQANMILRLLDNRQDV